MNHHQKSHIEQELKLTIADRESYEKIVDLLGNTFCGEEQQTNHYFDTSDFHLLRHAAMLRIRCIQNEKIITLKIAQSVSQGIIRAIEIEQILSSELFNSIPSMLHVLQLPQQFQLQLAALYVTSPLNCLGSVQNSRKNFKMPEGLLIELDRTDYGVAGVEYELECEFPDATFDMVKDFVMPLLLKTNISWTPQNKTKYQRFLERNYPETIRIRPITG